MKRKSKPNPEWDRVFKSNYRAKLLSSASWVALAESLLESARLLEPEVAAIWESLREWNATKDRKKLKSDEILSIYPMLVAFAIENFLKARLVEKCYREFSAEFDSSGKLPQLLKSHRLFDLAKEAGLKMTVQEEDLLRRLARAAVWSGRYPVPIEYKALSGGEEFSDGNVYSISYLGGEDIKRLRNLVDKIRKELNL